VLVPFTDFTNSWNPATGEPKVTCAADPSVCMTEKDKDGIYQFGLWVRRSCTLMRVLQLLVRLGD
jgi:hypothetical protein